MEPPPVSSTDQLQQQVAQLPRALDSNRERPCQPRAWAAPACHPPLPAGGGRRGLATVREQAPGTGKVLVLPREPDRDEQEHDATTRRSDA